MPLSTTLPELPKLVDIYATINRMRVLSPPTVVAEADNALRMMHYSTFVTTHRSAGAINAIFNMLFSTCYLQLATFKITLKSQRQRR